MNKLIYCIRHGESLHNVNFLLYGKSAFYGYKNKDTPLTNYGHEESIQLGLNWKEKHTIELVIVSPLIRTLDTCMNIFMDTDIPILCMETVREYPCGMQTCNQRKDIKLLESMYPRINFENCPTSEDVLWNPEREETIEELNNRIINFKQFLNNRTEKTIALISHSGFISQMIDGKIYYIENGDKELKHCYPYIMRL